jgi:PHD/YefM family antitoxin component YafN of YafNO toxin-antitoxin module
LGQERSYPPETITLSQSDFDALTERLNEKPDPEALESIRKLLDRRAPWDT